MSVVGLQTTAVNVVTGAMRVSVRRAQEQQVAAQLRRTRWRQTRCRWSSPPLRGRCFRRSGTPSDVAAVLGGARSGARSGGAALEKANERGGTPDDGGERGHGGDASECAASAGAAGGSAAAAHEVAANKMPLVIPSFEGSVFPSVSAPPAAVLKKRKQPGRRRRA
eukprot:TRINITY_DN3147_c0_g1_i1.p2 TRINITY_DN3147_c0_g1~~TRINITY_DN3147_c0_g1_i1.p2  ORF type:complete len:166 (-),score=37.99 TRINITY_DN3147_c0_g1_i1:176-673(-)